MTEVACYDVDGLAHRVVTRGHTVMVDEPESAGGNDTGMTPVELLLGAVTSCTAITIQLYAKRKGWQLGNTFIKAREVDDHIELDIAIDGNLERDQLERVHAIAKRCPVARALKAEKLVVLCRGTGDADEICVR